MTGGALQDVVDQTKLASLPDFGDLSHLGGGSSGGGPLDSNGVPAFLEQPQKAVKTCVRVQMHGLSLQREERAEIWRGVFLKKEGGGEDKGDANAGFYWESVKTCFGTDELPKEAPPPPGILEPAHMNAFCLTAAGKTSVLRLLTCFAYNSPDIQYCPHAYPIAAVFRHYLAGTTVQLLSLM